MPHSVDWLGLVSSGILMASEAPEECVVLNLAFASKDPETREMFSFRKKGGENC